MQRLILMALAAICLVSFAGAEAADKYPRNPDGYMPWATVGSNPCRNGTETTCTLEAALLYSGYPLDAQRAIEAEVDANRKERVEVGRGEKFDFVGFRNNGFVDKVITAWPKNERKFADRYQVQVGNKSFEAFIFVACLNWAMRWEKAPILIEPQPIAPLVAQYPAGFVPPTNCDGEGCDTCS